MYKYLQLLLLFLIIESCVNNGIIIRNNSDKSIYLIVTELDSSISNRWIFEYSQEYNYSSTDSYLTIRQIIEPKHYMITGIPDVRFINYKLYLYFIKYDSLLLLKKKDLDSTLISRFLLKKCVVTSKDILKQKKLEIAYP